MNITRESSERNADEIGSMESTIPTPESQTQEIRQFIEIHVWNEAPVDEDTTGMEETTGTMETTLQPAKRWAISPLRIALIGAIILLVVGAGYLVYPLLFAQNFTVTIIPKTQTVQTSATLIIDTRSPVSSGNIAGRILPALTMSQTETVTTTGTTYQSAQPGRGTLTFYNSALYAQTIGTGTLITGRDGTQVITDESVTVPAGQLSTNGQASVSAHTVITGYSANIPTNDIYGPCCLVNIEAQNSAFSGGVPAVSYQSVAKQDIDTAVSKLQTALIQSVNAAFQTQVQSSETLVTPSTCQPTINADHQVGEQATQVQVSLSLTCTSLVYDTHAFERRIGQIQPLAHYRLVDQPQIRIQSVVPGSNAGTYALAVQSTALWSYRFTQKELDTIATRIAGKSTHDAMRYLLHTSGIRHVSFSNGDTLPSDSSKIRFLFLTQQ